MRGGPDIYIYIYMHCVILFNMYYTYIQLDNLTLFNHFDLDTVSPRSLDHVMQKHLYILGQAFLDNKI